MMGLPFMLTDFLAKIPPALYHRILGWMKVDVDAFHEWVEGHCPCGLIGDYEEEDAA